MDFNSQVKRPPIIIILLVILLSNCTGEIYTRIPGGFMFVDQGKCADYLLAPGTLDSISRITIGSIEPHIVNYKYDDNFITVCQEDEQSCNCYFNEGFKQKPVINYYIYDIKKLKKMGPMSKIEFNKLRVKLEIDDDLDVNYIPFDER